MYSGADAILKNVGLPRCQRKYNEGTGNYNEINKDAKIVPKARSQFGDLGQVASRQGSCGGMESLMSD